MVIVENPHKFRVCTTSSGRTVFLGRSAENNELLVGQAKRNETLLHTVAPGSPFANIKGVRPSKKDVYEVAVLTAKYSQEWRDKKSDTKVHVFLKADTYKDATMKAGTFGVKKQETIKVKKSDIVALERELENGKAD